MREEEKLMARGPEPLRRLGRMVASTILGAATLGAVLPLGSAMASEHRTLELVVPEHQGFPTGVGPISGPPNNEVWIAKDGNSIAYGSADSFLGPSGLAQTYASVRTNNGWAATSLFPHAENADLLNAVNTIGLTEDMARVILSTSVALMPGDGLAS